MCLLSKVKIKSIHALFFLLLIGFSSFFLSAGEKTSWRCGFRCFFCVCLQPQNVKVVNESPLNTFSFFFQLLQLELRRAGKIRKKVSTKKEKKSWGNSVCAQSFDSLSVIKIKIVLKTGENKQKITKKSNISPEVDKKTQFFVRFFWIDSFKKFLTKLMWILILRSLTINSV